MTDAANTVRIALANIRHPSRPEESVTLAVRAIQEAASRGARVVAFPECFVPGYRGLGRTVAPADAGFLDRAWSAAAAAAAKGGITVVLGTERVVDGAVIPTALVINDDGSRAGFQDKVQIDPSEEGTYTAGSGRRVFQAGPLTFGVVICHEGWRYPETVRWAVRHRAQVVFHPHMHEAEPGSYRPTAYADPANTFHEKAALCRAAENSCYFATVNFASAGSPTTSAVVNPDGTLLSFQPYGQEGVLVADIDLTAATGLLARRYRPAGLSESVPTLRPATPDDTDAIAAVWHQGWRDGHLGPVPDSLLPHRRLIHFLDRVPPRIPQTTVATVASSVVGFVTVKGDEVEQVYVAAGSRGSEVASALLRHAEQVLAARFDRAWLAVASGNARARRFYEKSGWRDGGPLDYAAEIPGGTLPVPCRRYEKQLVGAHPSLR